MTNSQISTEPDLVTEIHKKKYMFLRLYNREPKYLILGRDTYLELKRQMSRALMHTTTNRIENSEVYGLIIAVVDGPHYLEVA